MRIRHRCTAVNPRNKNRKITPPHSCVKNLLHAVFIPISIFKFLPYFCLYLFHTHIYLCACAFLCVCSCVFVCVYVRVCARAHMHMQRLGSSDSIFSQIRKHGWTAKRFWNPNWMSLVL